MAVIFHNVQMGWNMVPGWGKKMMGRIPEVDLLTIGILDKYLPAIVKTHWKIQI